MKKPACHSAFGGKLWSALSFLGCLAIVAANAALLLSGCGSESIGSVPVNLQAQYSSAVNDARVATSDEIYRGLTPIVTDNNHLVWENGVVGSRILVASVAGGYAAAYKCTDPAGCAGNTCKEGGECAYGYDTWVTVAPELKSYFKSSPATLLRVVQLLGLPPSYATIGNSHEAKYVMEMWVNPKDLFRPCPDSEISDSECATVFPSDPFRVLDLTRKVRATEGLTVPVFKTYTAWFNNRTRNIYTATSASEAYPWTRLGYTYDWGRTDHVGLSEFVLNGAREDGSKIAVGIKSVRTISEYFSQ